MIRVGTGRGTQRGHWGSRCWGGGVGLRGQTGRSHRRCVGKLSDVHRPHKLPRIPADRGQVTGRKRRLQGRAALSSLDSTGQETRLRKSSGCRGREDTRAEATGSGGAQELLSEAQHSGGIAGHPRPQAQRGRNSVLLGAQHLRLCSQRRGVHWGPARGLPEHQAALPGGAHARSLCKVQSPLHGASAAPESPPPAGAATRVKRCSLSDRPGPSQTEGRLPGLRTTTRWRPAPFPRDHVSACKASAGGRREGHVHALAALPNPRGHQAHRAPNSQQPAFLLAGPQHSPAKGSRCVTPQPRGQSVGAHDRCGMWARGGCRGGTGNPGECTQGRQDLRSVLTGFTQ